MHRQPKGTFHAVEVDAAGDVVFDDSGRPVLAGDPVIQITRRAPERWGFDRHLGYQSSAGDIFVVPDDLTSFDSDLMSMPWPFAWLVPGTGHHIPGVLLHDGLVVSMTDATTQGPPTHIGPSVTREEADCLLREAMYSEGTTYLRRWLMWTGVMLGTIWATFWPRAYWRTAMVAYLMVITVFGLGATLDIFDAQLTISGIDGLWNLPWMGDRPWYLELFIGLTGAVLFPFLGSVVFLKRFVARSPGEPRASVLAGRRRDRYRMGVIAGLWFAVLLHVTLLVVIVYGIYRSTDRLIARLSAPDQ